MGAIVPIAADLSRERDPSARMLALVQPATDMLVRATALEEVNEIRSRAAAIERYARSIRLSARAIGAAQTIARRAEVRIGELDQKRGPGGRPRKQPPQEPRDEKPFHAGNSFSRPRRKDFRDMAERGDEVEAALGELAPQGKATRAAVLRHIRRDKLNETYEDEQRNRDQSPVRDMVELETVLRRTIRGLRQMRAAGQTFSARPVMG